VPELPEVETIKNQLKEKIIGKKIGKFFVKEVERRGKMLIIKLTKQKSLVFHLKMTGQLIYQGTKNKHTRKVFKFNDGSCLLFNDLRKFGWFKFVKDFEEMKEIKGLGPDALLIKEKYLRDGLQRRKTKIKALLLDQKFISGIGNIYADEILFEARIDPRKRASNLTFFEISSLYEAIKKILKKAIQQRGSSAKDYLDAFGKEGAYLEFHKVYQKTGKPCFVCKTNIQRVKINQRSTHFCPTCQNN